MTEELIPIPRYPGLGPFKKSEHPLFFGRNMEISELLHSVRAYDVFIFFGASGLGKSSLINAGLLPLLEREGIKEVNIKLEQQRQGSSTSPLNEVFGELKLSIDQSKLDAFPTKEKLLWNFLHAWSDKTKYPLLIFDQFENFFSYEKKGQAEFVKQIGEIVRGNIPGPLKLALEKNIDNDEFWTAYRNWIKSPRVKFLFVIRSDLLNLLDDISLEIPNILSQRFQLKPLSREQAKEAVRKPAAISDSETMRFETDPFNYDEESVKQIIDTLTDRSGEIDTSQLQVICNGIESMVLEKRKDEPDYRTVDPTLYKQVEGIKNLQKNFYTRQLSELKLKFPKSYDRILDLIETELITRNKRRTSLIEDQIVEFMNKETTSTDSASYSTLDIINEMVRLRILREEANNRGKIYEISHDSLITGILEAKEERVKSTEEIFKEKQKEKADQLKDEYYQVFGDGNYAEATSKILEAISIYESYEEYFREEIDATILKAKCLEAEKDFKEARSILEVAIERVKAKNLPDISGILAPIYEAIGSVDEGSNELRGARENYHQAALNYSRVHSYFHYACIAEYLAGLYESHTPEVKADLAQALYYYKLSLDNYKTVKDRIGIKRAEHSVQKIERAIKEKAPEAKASKAETLYFQNLFKGEKHHVELPSEGTVFIGRDTADIKNDLALMNTYISRRHLSINAQHKAEDLQSLNGTTLNGSLLEYGRPQNIKDQDVLVLAGLLPLLYSQKEHTKVNIPPNTWGLCISNDSMKYHYLTELYYSIRIKKGFEISTEKDENALLQVRVELENFQMKHSPIKLEGDEKWGLATAFKGETRIHNYYLLPEDNWVDLYTTPLMLARWKQPEGGQAVIIEFSAPLHLIINREKQ